MGEEFGVSNRNGDSWRFQPTVKEAPSNEGAFLVPATPHVGKPRGWGTLRVWVSAAGVSRYLQQKRVTVCIGRWPFSIGIKCHSTIRMTYRIVPTALIVF